MKISWKWLSDYIDLVLTPEELAERLTMSGTEVAAVTRLGATWDKIYVGRIVELVPHPNADRLQLATVDYGGRSLTVVTGAFNIKVGDKVPLALPGAKLIDGHSAEYRQLILEPTSIRGIFSEGMVCSGKELGLSEDHEGILILDPQAKVGAELSEELGDIILDLEITPNRPDCLSVIGIAREVAALTGQSLQEPRVEIRETLGPIEGFVNVEIADPDLCPRYVAGLIAEVHIAPSPRWMQDRLRAAGLRPINNIVDITNYVMLEWGQPLHAFDYEKIAGNKIIVRRAKTAEQLVTLDGVEHLLTAEMLVIADAERAIALAGVMGGADTEVTEKTSTILLESANFDPLSIRRTARSLRLSSEASRRFEKGLSREQPLPALRRAIQLMQQLAGGQVAKGVIDSYPAKSAPKQILLTEDEIRRILGLSFGLERTAAILHSLQCETSVQGQGLLVTVPSHRTDISLPADLIEDVARIVGYEAIPSVMPAGRLPDPSQNRALYWENVVRDVLVGCGFTEVITYSLTSRRRLEKLVPTEPAKMAVPEWMTDLRSQIESRVMPLHMEPLSLVNPLSIEMECLRTTAIVSLLETLSDNLRNIDRDIFLFEVGRIYLPRPADLPEERRVLTMVMGAYRSGRDWGTREEIDFYDLKGAVETLLSRVGLTDYGFVPVIQPTFHPGRTAAIISSWGDVASTRSIEEHQVIGVLGEVSQEVQRRFDLSQRTFLCGIDLDRVFAIASPMRMYRPLPKFPPVVQDVAIVLDRDIPAGRVAALISEVGGELVQDVGLFDVYEGEPIPPGRKSLAYRITYQASDRTLTDEEVKTVHERIERALIKNLGAELRAPS
ncbi:MAG: phenylalanine--tRNA ligase subunit beta [Chloroflexi bacterium]|nr:phenylalanine--tRNA ligase subunit beta [Chloroflexota bacterium]MCL5076441.1 phenylalanine--tRNA ligase subunit beta [Chloroflexota bacterium]